MTSNVTKQWLNRAIAASTFKYDNSLRKKNENPDSLRGAYYKCTKGRRNIFEYEFTVNNYMSSRFEDDYCPRNYGEHYIDGALYTHEDVPCEGPEYFNTRNTKMYTFSETLSNRVYMINWNPITKIFYSANAFIVGNTFISYPCSDRSAYDWSYSDSEKVDFVDLFDTYPSIVQDLIDDLSAETLIDYIRKHN